MEEDNDLSSSLALDTIEEIGPATKNRLEEAGFKSIKDLVVRGPVEISETTGMEMDKSIYLCNKARVRLEEVGIIDKSFITATKLYNKRKKEERISTGSKNLDDLLEGGIETRAVTEIYGEYGTGKTQICHTLCLLVQQKKSKEWINSKALYIDTENTFRPERIVSIALSRNLDPDKALENIIIAKAYNSAHQELIVEQTGPIIDTNKVKLLIVDSAVAHYRAEFLGRATLSDRQQRLNKFMHMLLRIAETYNVAVLATNQIQSSPDAIFGDAFKPTGGHVVAHTSTYRIYLKRSGKNRIARMVDSPYHPEREVLFTLAEQGLSDPDESIKY
ncbi:MAG TPA: DNA repair and recombination protein RadA [Nitrososphaeraceae archaeon]|nr:DNA repair and recombination protein RadA [Nitrososphaeraceae archaeon]